MKLMEWLYSNYPNQQPGGGAWGTLHICTLVLCVTFIILTTVLLKSKSEKQKRIILWVLSGIIIVLGVARRIINLCKTDDYSTNHLLRTLLPRPGCAISCWLVVIATIVNKKFFYNFASFVSIICAVIFFAYPGVGFNNKYIVFEDLYSILTHATFLVTSILFITLKFTDFKYKKIYKEMICLVIMLIYVFLEMKVLKIEPDPFYFMQNNEVQEIIGLKYNLYLPLYLLFITVYINAFYLISDRKNVFSKSKIKAK
jgi:hypothetical protein